MPRSGEGAQRVRRAGEGLEERRPAVGDGKWELRREGKGWGGEECGGKGWRRERRQGGRALGLRGRVPAGAEGGARGKVERGASGGGVELGGKGGGLLRGRELESALLSLNRKCTAECVCAALPRRDRVPDCRSVGSVWETAALPRLSTLIPLGSTQTRTPPPPTDLRPTAGAGSLGGGEESPKETRLGPSACSERDLRSRNWDGGFEPGHLEKGRAGEEASGVRPELDGVKTPQDGIQGSRCC